MDDEECEWVVETRRWSDALNEREVLGRFASESEANACRDAYMAKHGDGEWIKRGVCLWRSGDDRAPTAATAPRLGPP